MSLPRPYYQDDAVTIYHGDCREILPELPKVDLVLTDPPYGIGWEGQTTKSIGWTDDESFDPAPFLLVGRWHLFWGAIHFADRLPPSQSWFVWIKRPNGFDFSRDPRGYCTIDLAWSDYGAKARHKTLVWDGGKRAGDSSNREFLHSAQKPLEIMEWCVHPEAQTILDPFMGSGTTLRAAKDLGRKAIGIEIEEKYCEIAARRMAQEVMAL